MTNTQKVILLPALILLLISGALMVGYAQISRADFNNGNVMHGMMGGWARGPGIFGTITSVDGETIVVAGGDGTVYTVDANNASFTTIGKDDTPQGASLSDLEVGDTVRVRGDVEGTNVSAVQIVSGMPNYGIGMHGREGYGLTGKVTNVEGNMITVTTPRGTTLTIDASDASIVKMVNSSLSDVEEGERVGIQGMMNGSQIRATRIMTDL